MRASVTFAAVRPREGRRKKGAAIKAPGSSVTRPGSGPISKGYREMYRLVD
jgi:hypothetical protein